jgi:hypothetical protein
MLSPRHGTEHDRRRDMDPVEFRPDGYKYSLDEACCRYPKIPTMQPPGTLKNLIEYTTLAATTAQAIGTSAQVPFLPSTAALTLAILKCAQVSRTLPYFTWADFHSLSDRIGMNVLNC